jgi:hypothetical protein
MSKSLLIPAFSLQSPMMPPVSAETGIVIGSGFSEFFQLQLAAMLLEVNESNSPDDVIVRATEEGYVFVTAFATLYSGPDWKLALQALAAHAADMVARGVVDQAKAKRMVDLHSTPEFKAKLDSSRVQAIAGEKALRARLKLFNP